MSAFVLARATLNQQTVPVDGELDSRAVLLVLLVVEVEHLGLFPFVTLAL